MYTRADTCEYLLIITAAVSASLANTWLSIASFAGHRDVVCFWFRRAPRVNVLALGTRPISRLLDKLNHRLDLGRDLTALSFPPFLLFPTGEHSTQGTSTNMTAMSAGHTNNTSVATISSLAKGGNPLSTHDMCHVPSGASSTACAGTSKTNTPADSSYDLPQGMPRGTAENYLTNEKRVDSSNDQPRKTRLAEFLSEDIDVKSVTFQLSAFCFMSVCLFSPFIRCDATSDALSFDTGIREY